MNNALLTQTFLRSLLLACLCITPAQAKNSKTYVDVDFKELVKFTAHYEALKLTDDKVFANYLEVVECDLYKSTKDSQFTLQEIRQAVLNGLQKEKNKDIELHFKVPMEFKVSNYNFDTQSFTIMPDNQLQKVNLVQLTPKKFYICDKETNLSLMDLPGAYYTKLNFPVSLYRIPLQKNVAQQIEQRLDKTTAGPPAHIIYGLMYIDIDAIPPEVEEPSIGQAAYVHGQVDRIELFMDAAYKLPLNHLNYADNF